MNVTHRIPLIALAAAALSCALPSVAMAQSDAERAQEAFDRGAAFYMEGKYARALVEFEKSNRAVSNVTVVLNMALTHGKLGNYEQAIERVDEARQMGGLPGEALAIAGGASSAWSSALAATAVAESRAALVVKEEPLDPVVKPVEPPSGGSSVVGTLGVVSLSLAVAGGVGTAVHYFTVYQPARQELDDAAGSDQETIDDLLATAQSQQTVGQVLLFTSVGLGVLGGVLLFVDASSAGESAQILPVVGPDMAGAQVNFSF
jgi:tetratricopeptide (TPR) repeat protein